jgi:hypothetical protein
VIEVNHSVKFDHVVEVERFVKEHVVDVVNLIQVDNHTWGCPESGTFVYGCLFLTCRGKNTSFTIAFIQA